MSFPPNRSLAGTPLIVAVACAMLVGCSGGSSGNAGQGFEAASSRTVNRSPVAKSDTASSMPGATVSLHVLANDSDPEGGPVLLDDVDPAPVGAVSVADNATPGDPSDDFLTYVGDDGFEGTVRFGYTVSDEAGAQSRGWVTLYVEHPEPTAGNDKVTTAPGTAVAIPVLANDAGNAGVAIAISEVTLPANGTVTIDDQGTARADDDVIVYTPAPGFVGSDSFLYSVSDGRGARTAAVSVDVSDGSTPDANGMNGRVIKGPLRGSRISFYALDEAGLPVAGGPLAQALTDDDGDWSLDRDAFAQSVLVVADGGSYEDEANSPDSGRRRLVRHGAGETLESYLPAGQSSGTLSPYSAALLHKARRETNGGNFAAMLESARAGFSTAMGLDPVATVPANPIAPADNSSAAARQYALYAGGFANALNRAAVLLGLDVPNHELAQGLIRDLSDCTLDGRESELPVIVTVRGAPAALPSSIDLNLEILRFRNNYADTYADTALPAFDAAACRSPIPVADVTAPVVTLLGANPMSVALGAAFVDPGATANDDIDADVTASITVSGVVNTAAAGTYELTYTAEDTTGNVASVVRTVVVVAGGVPALILNGPASLSLEAGTPFVDAGALATDAQDGDLTASITVSGSVDTLVPGTYTITYSVTDSDGNSAAPATRTIAVVDTTPPVIAITGSPIVSLIAGASYIDAGATALDIVDGDLTAAVSTINPVNTGIPGTYIVTYSVGDSAGNVASATRTVVVSPSGVPAISLLGPAVVTVEATDVYVDAGATATDAEDGDLSAAIVVTNPVDTLVPGTYDVWFDVADSDGNMAPRVTRTVNVVDTTPPTITLTGSTPVTVEAGSVYVDAGASASDSVDGDLTGSIAVVNPVNTSVPGSYTVTYDVSDGAGNAAAQVTRTVNVVDTTPPTITLTGSTPVTVEAGSVYVDAGASASDSVDGDLTASILVVNPVNTSVPGSYTVTYDVTDAAGNTAAQVTRTVNVVDTTPPTITLTGSTPVTVEAGSVYVDAGASASDSVDGDLTGSIAVVNPVNTSVLGSYTVTYDVSDGAGNAAAQVTRTVNVVDTTPPTITLLGPNPDAVPVGSGPYTEPGYTATDAYEGNVTGAVVVSGSVDTTVTGTYTLYYDVTDGSGNAAVTQSRVVSVQTASESSDTDGDGLSDAIEQAITGDPGATQALTVFIDPDPSITVRDGTSWATAFGGIDDLVAANGGFLPQGLSAAQPTYIVLGDTTAAPATGGDPDRWQLIVSNGNCSHIAVIGSLDGANIHPGTGMSEPSTLLNAPNGRVLDATNCANLQFHQVQFVDSGGPGIAEGGAVSIATSDAVFDNVIFDGNTAADAGGALKVRNSFGATTISNSVFRDNEVFGGAGIGGAALYLANNAAVDVVSTRFEYNESDPGSGGAIHASINAPFTIDDAVFVGNEATLDGGAMYVARNNVVAASSVTNTLFSGNEADREGGALYLWCNEFAPTVRVFNNLLTANGALRGGAIAVDDCDGIQIDNNTVAMNEASSATGGGAVHLDTVSTAGPNFRPMPEIYDNIFFGNIDAGGASAFSVNNLPGWNQQEQYDNLIDVAADRTVQDVLLSDYTLEFDRGWYLQQAGSQAVDSSATNAIDVTKFQADPNRTTDVTGTPDIDKVDAGYHFALADTGPAASAVAVSSLESNKNGGQCATVQLLDAIGEPVGAGHRVALEIAAGSAPVALKHPTTATYPSAVSAFAARDLGDGRYEIGVSTVGVFGPDVVLIDVYADDAYVGQVSVAIDP